METGTGQAGGSVQPTLLGRWHRMIHMPPPRVHVCYIHFALVRYDLKFVYSFDQVLWICVLIYSKKFLGFHLLDIIALLCCFLKNNNGLFNIRRLFLCAVYPQKYIGCAVLLSCVLQGLAHSVLVYCIFRTEFTFPLWFLFTQPHDCPFPGEPQRHGLGQVRSANSDASCGSLAAVSFSSSDASSPLTLAEFWRRCWHFVEVAEHHLILSVQM